jgi:23S rRNA pseudouridine2605 synthase
MKKENTIRLNKAVAERSKLSRREADKAIQEGRVKVGRHIETNPARQVGEEEKLFLNGRLLKTPTAEFTVIVYSKHKGELVTKSDPRGRKTIYDTLPKKYSHFIPIGRLDYASEGLLLLSDSARVAEALMKSDLERVYNIKIDGPVTDEMIVAMKEGYFAEDASKGAHQQSRIGSMQFAPFNDFKIIKNGKNYSRLRVSISEGKNRELRRFFGCFDRKVLDLKRVAYGWVELNALPEGKIRFLEKSDYAKLHKFMKQSNKKKEQEENAKTDL